MLLGVIIDKREHVDNQLEYEMWRAIGVQPKYMLWHDLREYIADRLEGGTWRQVGLLLKTHLRELSD